MMRMRLGALQLHCLPSRHTPPRTLLLLVFARISVSLRNRPDMVFCKESMTVRADISQRDTLSFTRIHYPPQEVCAFRQDFFDHCQARYLLCLHLLSAFSQGDNLPPSPSQACQLLHLLLHWRGLLFLWLLEPRCCSSGSFPSLVLFDISTYGSSWSHSSPFNEAGSASLPKLRACSLLLA